MTMDVTIDHARLLAAVNAAASIAEKRSVAGSTSINGVLLDATRKGITITATDMLLTSSELLGVRVDTEVTAEGGALVSARHLLDVVKTMPSGAIRVRSLENHWIEITARRSSFKLMGQAPREFPEIPTAPRDKDFVKVPAAAITSQILATVASISMDEARVNLNGLLWESNGKRSVAVSTDGHRLTKIGLDLAGGPKLERGVIIPRKGVTAIQALLARTKPADVELGFGVGGGGWMYVRVSGLTLTIKLSNVVFPPYEQVIPSTVKREAVVDREEITVMLRRACVMAPEKTATVRVAITAKTKTLDLTADNPDLGTVSDSVELVSYTGGDIVAGYNAHYLLDALGVMLTKQVRMHMQNKLDPLVLQPVDGPDFLAVVMPMRV
jgi:DNA polymerase-3 subunit beta